MPKLDIIDDILAPRDTLIVRFDGKNPFLATTMVPNMLRSVLKITSKDVLETDIRWDVAGGDMHEFYGKWMGKRKEDVWTMTKVRVIIQGAQHSKEKTGWARIEIKGFIQTRYAYSNFIQRSLWWFYNRVFYNQQRRMYIDKAKDDLYEMRDIFQRALGISPEEQG